MTCEVNGGLKCAEYIGVFSHLPLSAKRIPELSDAIFVAPVQAVFFKKLSFWTAKDTFIT
jgi:hypothetical protein